jgi:hypothetical protein
MLSCAYNSLVLTEKYSMITVIGFLLQLHLPYGLENVKSILCPLPPHLD